MRLPHARRAAALAALLLCLGAAAGARASATLLVVNRNAAGEGFNDPAPWTPTGGNPATTVGQAALNAFQHAADLWGQRLQSAETIRIAAKMELLPCTETQAVLGQAGTTSVHRDFTGALLADTWYPQALANALAGTDLNPQAPDVTAAFNSAIAADPNCLGGAAWYFGYDGAPGPGEIDFVTVVLHEIAHGLGFQTYVDVETGALWYGRDDVYMTMIERAGAVPPDYPSMSDFQRASAAVSDPSLRWTGGHASYMAAQVPLVGGTSGERVRLHAPNPLEPGSSVAHWSADVSPNELMEPRLTGVNHDPGLAVFLLMDLGWPTDASVPVVWRGPRAAVTNGEVTLTWDWEADEPVAGFRVYRREAGKAGAALLTGDRLLDRGAGRYVDAAPPPGASLLYRVAAVRPDGSEIASPEAAAVVAAARLELAGCRPNPFNAATEVDFALDRPAAVRLRVYDPAGRLVRTLVDERREAGLHTAFWDGRDDGGRSVASGVYVCRLEAGAQARAVRMTLLK